MLALSVASLRFGRPEARCHEVIPSEMDEEGEDATLEVRDFIVEHSDVLAAGAT